MKCGEFAQLVVELARAELIDAGLRERGLAHAEACAVCATRLAAERALSGGLRALAFGDEDQQASAATETALLAAFRVHASTATSINVSNAGGNVISFAAKARPAYHAHWRWAAAAAMILCALALVAVRWQSVDAPVDAGRLATNPSPAPTAPLALNVGAPVPATGPPTAPAQSPRRVVRQRRSVPFVDDGARVVAGVGEFVPIDDETETLTEFLPLMNESGLPPAESVQLIRVRMPRAALVPFGIPINPERAYESVKAEFVLGDGGLARSVRFVTASRQ